MKKKGKGKRESQFQINLVWDTIKHMESLIKIETLIARLHTEKATLLRQHLQFIRLSDMADNNPIKNRIKKGK